MSMQVAVLFRPCHTVRLIASGIGEALAFHATACCPHPFVAGGQTKLPACHLVQPFHKVETVCQRHILHWQTLTFRKRRIVSHHCLPQLLRHFMARQEERADRFSACTRLAHHTPCRIAEIDKAHHALLIGLLLACCCRIYYCNQLLFLKHTALHEHHVAHQRIHHGNTSLFRLTATAHQQQQKHRGSKQYLTIFHFSILFFTTPQR